MAAATEEAQSSPRNDRLQRALALLEEALQIIDGLEDYPEAGARLHGLIEGLNEERNV